MRQRARILGCTGILALAVPLGSAADPQADVEPLLAQARAIVQGRMRP